jgi:hypothetical protein
VSPEIRSSFNKQAFGLLCICLLGTCAFLLFNHYEGLGFFDASEFSIRILTGGIAHPPGYPLYLFLSRLIQPFAKNPFRAQHWLSILSLIITLASFYKTFRPKNLQKDQNTYGAVILSCTVILSSFYIKLFTVLPDVFILNLALFATLGLAIKNWYLSKNARSLFWVFFIYGLGVSHHHTLALTIPAFLILLLWKIVLKSSKINWKAGLCGFLIGLLPVFCLCIPHDSSVTRTYHSVQTFQDLLSLLLRSNYGSLQLSSLAFTPDTQKILLLGVWGTLKNFNWVGICFFIPALVKMARSIRSSHISRQVISFQDRPMVLYAGTTIIAFVLFFLPNCNIPLSNSSYETTLLRFYTIPFFLMCYFLVDSFKVMLDFGSKKFKKNNAVLFYALFLVSISLNLFSSKQLQYGNFKFLDRHVENGFETIFNEFKPKLSGVHPYTYECVIFAESDTLLFSVQYYNDFMSNQRCFIFFPGSFTGVFKSIPEENLKDVILNTSGQRFDLFAALPEPEKIHLFFLELEKRGYHLFLFYSPDYSRFVNSSFGYRPVGNILELVGNRKASSSAAERQRLYEQFLSRTEAFLNSTPPHQIPSQIVDVVARTALFQNLIEYPKFNSYFPEKLPGIGNLELRTRKLNLKLQEEYFYP